MLDLIILIFLIIVIGLIALYSVITGISPMPSSTKAKAALLKEIQTIVEKNNKPHFTLYELGAGWGGTAFMLAKHFPQATIIAFELSPIPYLYMVCLKRLGKYNNLRLKRENFLTHNFSKADILYSYLFRKAMKKITKKFQEESPQGQFLISNSFACDALNPIKKIHLGSFLSQELLIYVK